MANSVVKEAILDYYKPMQDFFNTYTHKASLFLKTDVKYLMRSGFWLNLNFISGSLLSFVLSIGFSYFLSKDTFGIYRYILSVAGIATAFSLTGMNTAVTRAVAQGFEGVFKKAIWEQCKWSILQCLFIVSFSIYYFFQDNNVYGITFAIVAFFAPISSIANTYNALLHGKRDFKTSALYGMGSNVAYVAVMFLVIYFLPQTIFLVGGYYLINTLTNLYFFMRTERKYKIWKLEEYRGEDLSYGKHLSLMNIANLFSTQIDNILVYHLLGPAALALYSFATIIPERIRVLFGFIATAAFPKFSNASFLDIKNLALKKTLQLLLLAAIILIVYVLSAPTLFEIFFPQYLDSVKYSQVFSISLLAIATNIPLTILFAQRFQKQLYYVNVGSPIIKIIITLISIWYLGIWGAIISKILGHIVTLVLSSFYVIKEKNEKSA